MDNETFKHPVEEQLLFKKRTNFTLHKFYRQKCFYVSGRKKRGSFHGHFPLVRSLKTQMHDAMSSESHAL